jgi:hypothetical protein
VPDDVVSTLLPILSRSLEEKFNIFDVMHHGSHEKQISNVFGWLLDASGSHRLGDRFVRIFLDEVNQGLDGAEPFDADQPYRVSQEVNTAEVGVVPDIADLVLQSKDAVLVVENYFTSDGHGHSYHGYLRHGQRGGLRAAVVLLCRDEDRSLLADGWETAVVVTYGTLIGRLRVEVDVDRDYRTKNAEAYSFIEQMDRKFVRGRGLMEDREVLDFVIAMCETGESARYAEQRHDQAAERFARDVSQQAQERFVEGRALLSRVKEHLAAYTRQAIVPQLAQVLGDGVTVGSVKANWVGTWRWTIVITLNDGVPEDYVALMFGPTVLKQMQETGHGPDADFSVVYVWRKATGEFRPTAVSVQEVLEGLEPRDVRLRDVIVDMLAIPRR